ncbi:MAG: NADH-quinone oxidoreductase subunit L [Bacteroidota bacterium]
MKLLIALIPALPFLSFLILAFAGKQLGRRMSAILGSASVGLSALITIVVGINFMTAAPDGAIKVHLWEWLSSGGFTANIAFSLDALSLVFCFVITFVGALIHIYSIEFMAEDEGCSRFFAYMNLFVGSMLVLVLADNLLLMYLGWEGVGLCSYLLIGFWHKEPENGYAARKAFIITRIGDTAMLIGLFLLFINLGTLTIDELMQRASIQWAIGSPLAITAAALLLGGAVGKSAQLPLQTWLPDAMAGPSPVSALIHAATMVTAGVYLIARTHVLFSLAPVVQAIVAIIGALTLLIAGFSALAQHDLKRILAYSTISQIGYMFLALGLGAWNAAIFHFFTHAFFKALLFLAAGSVIVALNEEHDIFKMGGLRKKLKTVFITFIIGSASLAALPLVTAGFYSKDEILWLAWSSPNGNALLWLAGIVGAFLTSLYTFRMVFITFYGETKTEPTKIPGKLMMVPLIILAVLSVIAGFIELPGNFGVTRIFSNMMETTLPAIAESAHSNMEFIFQLIAAIVTIAGIWLAYRLYLKREVKPAHGGLLHNFFYSGWGFDKLYDFVFVRPIVSLSEIDKNDVIDSVYTGIVRLVVSLNKLFSRMQNGRLRWYMLVMAVGIVLLITIMVTL